MDVKSLKFFNNKGNQLNFQMTDGVWSGKMLFDRNGSDTYKVQSIYLMEETEPLSDSNVAVEKFQYFPTGHNMARSSSVTGVVTDILRANASSAFNTKWVYVDNANAYKVGDRIFFEGIGGDFEKYVASELSTFAVLSVRSSSILIETATANNSFTNLTSLTGVTITCIHCMELEDTAESWNQTNLNSWLKAGQPVIIDGTQNNDSINYVSELVAGRTLFRHHLSPSYTPSAGDTVKITIQMLTDRLLLYDGSIAINAVTNEITLASGLPKSIQVGYEVAIQRNVAAVNTNNLQFLTVTSIDASTNTITVSASGPLFTQTVGAFLYMSTNKITAEQQMLKLPDGSYDISHTLRVMANSMSSMLASYSLTTDFPEQNTFALCQIVPTINKYFTLTGEVYNNGTLTYTIPVTADNRDIAIIRLTNTLTQERLTESPSKNGYVELHVSDIDSYGLDVLMNGEVFHTDFHTDDATTISDWHTAYSTAFQNRGIGVTQYSDGLYFETTYPNVTMNIDFKLGQLADYTIFKTDYSFEVYQDLTVTIDGVAYRATFDTDTSTTITSWVNTHKYKLLEYGITVSYVPNVLTFGTLTTKTDPVIKINAGYDVDAYAILNTTSLRHTANCAVVSSNKIISGNSGVNFETRNYYTGQTLVVSGVEQIVANGVYNIVSVDPTEMVLSYQGPMWDVPGDVVINAGKGLRKPTRGLNTSPTASIHCTWDDTIKDEIFFFDFGGSQLVQTSVLSPTVPYTGVLPLCGADNEYDVILNDKPNLDPTKAQSPYHQQTVFDDLYFDLAASDDPVQPGYPGTIQVHVGYNSLYEGVHNSTMNVYFEEHLTNTINTDINLGDDIVEFMAEDNSVNLVSSVLNFINMGYVPGQIITFKSTDNTGDGKQRMSSLNSGKKFTISSVSPLKMILEGDTVVSESSIQSLPSISPPYYTNGVMNTSDRSMSIEIIVQPKLILQVQMWGQTESEDERHRMNLERTGRNLYPQDMDILIDYDSDEKGTDWVLLNNKRKQMLISGNEIFDYIGSYKSIKNAINFWEWNTLELHEYFINVDTKSPDYGKLHTIDVIGLFEGTAPDHSKKKMPVRLPNASYRKTNKFSLLYSLTDDDGTIINGLSVEEIYAKLYKLKGWLVEKVVPVGTQLRDVSFKLKSADKTTAVVSTLESQRINATSSHDAIRFDVTGYTIPVNAAAGSYSIAIMPKSMGDNFHYEVRVKTFGLELFNSAKTYLTGAYVFSDGKVWVADRNSKGVNPASTTNTGQWVVSSDWTMSPIQVFGEQRFDNTPVLFTINKNLDPNFEVTLTSYGDYGLPWTETRNYTLDYGVWN